MPTYAYVCGCGNEYSSFRKKAGTEKKVACPACGVGNKADWQRTFAGNESFKSSCWPKKSNSMAIAAKDVGRQQEILARKGVHTEYVKDSQSNTAFPVLRSPEHNKRHAEALGFTNLSGGGWSDPVAVHSGKEFD